MLIPLERRVDEPEFRRLLLKHFPSLEVEVEDDAGLIHLEMAALERLANVYIKAGDFSGLKETYEFVGDLARHKKELHPDVLNAIHVSFLEGLNFENRKHGAEAKRLLPPVLTAMWKAQMEHNRKIGWLK
jgi:hypothetical protein